MAGHWRNPSPARLGDGASLSPNTVLAQGAGLWNSGQLTVTHSSVFGNVSSYIGGGLADLGSSQAIISAATFANNSATYGGGLINAGTGSGVIVSNSLFTHNRASYRGGAIDNEDILKVMTDTFAYNSALNGMGGGVANDGAFDSEIDSSAFFGNYANADGGAIYSASAHDLTFHALTLTNDSLSTNVAATGGGVSHNGGTLTILNSTLNANNAATGGNLAASSGTLSLKNTIIASGSPTNCVGSITNGGHNL